MSDAASKKISVITIVGIAAFVLLFYWSLSIVVTFRVPQTGASVRWRYPLGYQIVNVQPGSSAARAGLRPGDIVRYANLADRGCSWVPRWLRCRPPLIFYAEGVPAYELAHPVPLLVRRNPHHWFYTAIDPRAGSHSYPVGDAVVILMQLLVYTAFVVLGTWLALLRPGLMTWGFFAFCVSAAPTGYANVISMQILHARTSVDDAVFYVNSTAQLGLAGLPVFLLRFPNDNSPGWRLPMLVFTLCTVPWILPVVFFVIPAQMEHLPALKTSIFLYSFGILATMYVQARGVNRQRLQWVIAGVAAAISGALLMNAPLLRGMTPDFITLAGTLIHFISTLLYAIMPICIAYAIVKHRVIDVRFIANRAIIFGILLALFAIVFAGLDWIFTQYVSQSLWQIAIGMAVAFGLGWAARTFASRLVSWVDRAFFKKHYAAMTELRELRIALEGETQPEEVQRIVILGVADVLKLGSAALFVAVGDGGFIRQTSIGWGPGTVWHLFKDDQIALAAAHRNKPFSVQGFTWTDMGVPRGAGEPALGVPVISRRRLVALALYGAHVSGPEIDPDETRLLKDLCAAAAPAFDQRATGILGTAVFAAEAKRTAR